MFKVNDVVIYGSAGICKIVDIRDEKLGDEVNKYYILKPVFDEKNTFFVPVLNENLTSKIHDILTYDEALEYLVNVNGISSDEAEVLLKEEKNNIGRALIRHESSEESIGRAIAHDFLDAILRGSPLSAMLCSVPLEKERGEVFKFAEEMSEILIAKIKQSGHLSETAREYVRMYDALNDLIPTLYTNINLSLFFTILAAKLDSAKTNK